ncbi:secretoglobin, family 3A, member 1, isoform CRA_c [Rattus norvegicus]|uniref:Secretoglobin, family 3A, member 1, isoform CRA_c n=1 Tax=Rattus norvegicus TaxID=10116 RepID=A6HDX4_RAT|nr:secretoglobin, family 3A, member 1, isoform CRA_c [Rattus norvegicus]
MVPGSASPSWALRL